MPKCNTCGYIDHTTTLGLPCPCGEGKMVERPIDLVGKVGIPSDSPLGGAFAKIGEMNKIAATGRCPLCNKQVDPVTEFKDDISKREYRLSGYCQACQDKEFADPDDAVLDKLCDTDAICPNLGQIDDHEDCKTCDAEAKQLCTDHIMAAIFSHPCPKCGVDIGHAYHCDGCGWYLKSKDFKNKD